MATRKKQLQFTASIRVCAVVEVPIAGLTLEDALAHAKALRIGEVLGEMTGICDNEAPEVVTLGSNRWLD